MKRTIVRRFLIVDTVETWTIAVVNAPAATPSPAEIPAATGPLPLAAEGNPRQNKTPDDA